MREYFLRSRIPYFSVLTSYIKLKPYILSSAVKLIGNWKPEHEGKGSAVPEIDITCFVFHVKRDERSAEMFSVMLT